MKEKKDSKAKTAKSVESENEEKAALNTKAELKTFLTSVRDQLFTSAAPPIHSVTALQYVFRLDNVYELFDKANKEIAKEIWVKLKQSGIQLKNPPILFAAEDGLADTN